MNQQDNNTSLNSDRNNIQNPLVENSYGYPSPNTNKNMAVEMNEFSPAPPQLPGSTPYGQLYPPTKVQTTIFTQGLPNGLPCQICMKTTNNKFQMVSGGKAYCWFIVLLIFFWPLCWLPCCLDRCRDT